jgi:hypothetical protein
MLKIKYDDYFWKSVKDICLVNKYDDIRVLSLVKIFETHKATETPLPEQHFRVDKKSGKNKNNDIFKPYHLNNIYHCHLGIKNNGDPLLVYKKENNDIKLICLTTHHEMFNLKEQFVNQYNDEFPIKENIDNDTTI